MYKRICQQKAKILVTQKLQSQVTVLHSQCPTNREWSGLLLCRITGGSIEKPEELEITAEEAFLMDLGDASFTSFEASEDWITFFEKFPQIDPTKPRAEDNKWYIGKIHSHHNMSAFHSGTDTQDLVENAPKLPFFLSLVVNYACNPFAEIAIAGEVEQKSVTRNKWSLRNFLVGEDKIEKKADKKAFTYIIPCDVLYLTEQPILDQVALIRERNKPKSTTYVPPYQSEYTQPKNQKEEKKLKEAPIGYKTLLPRLTSLLTLGCGNSNTMGQPPMLTYDYIDYLLTAQNKDSYFKAFKYYFMDSWFDDEYSISNFNEEDIIEGLRFFVGLDVNKNKWLTIDFNKMLYELEEEIKLLRSVQRNALV